MRGKPANSDGCTPAAMRSNGVSTELPARCDRLKPSLKRNINRFTVLGVALGATWTLAALGPFAILIWLPALVLTIHGRLVLATLTIAFSPPPVYFAQATTDYFRGNAVVIEIGTRTAGDRNLDPDLRCYRVQTGAIKTGDEWVRAWPNNGAVKLMIAMFGPMPGTYHGPYPTIHEAERLFEAQAPVRFEPVALLGDRIELPNRTIRLATGVGSTIFSGSSSGHTIDWREVDPKLISAWDYQIVSAAASMWGDTCLVIRLDRRIATDQDYWQDAATIRTISSGDQVPSVKYVHTTFTLVDIETGRPFAIYTGVGQGSTPHVTIEPRPW